MTTQLRPRLCVLLLIFVVLGVYYPAIFSPLNSVDDPGTVNALLNLDSFNLREIFAPGAVYFRPLLLLSFWADKTIWGLQESFMHLENVLFHLVNVLLVFAVARRAAAIRRVESPLVPLAAALLFAVHPINTESVNWISGRTDPLACMFILSSSFFLLKPAAFPAVSPWSSLFASLCLLAACLAKETAIFFLPGVLLLPFFASDETSRVRLWAAARRNWLHFVITAAAGAGFFLYRNWGSHHSDAGVNTVVSHVAGPQSSGALLAAKVVLKAAGFYLKKMFFPFPLNFGIMQVSNLYLPVGGLVILLVLWLLARRTLAAYFFLCALAVGSSALLIPLLNLTWTPLAERYLYIPSAFFALGVASAIDPRPRAERLPQWQAAAAVAVLVVCVWGTATRTLLWQDNLALFKDTLAKSPGFVPAQNEIAVALAARGQDREAARVISSMRLSEGLVNRQYGLMTKAQLLAHQGDLDGAIALLQEALKDPGKNEVTIARRILSFYQVKIQTGKCRPADCYQDSIRLLSRLYQLTGDPFYLYRLGSVQLVQKERALARESFRVAAQKAPAGAFYREPALRLSQRIEASTAQK